MKKQKSITVKEFLEEMLSLNCFKQDIPIRTVIDGDNNSFEDLEFIEFSPQADYNVGSESLLLVFKKKE